MPRMTEHEYLLLKRNILKKLYAHNAFTKGHMLEERLQNGIPKYLAGFIAEVLSDLIKQEFAIHYGKTKHGDAYQLNIKRLKEIEKLILPRTDGPER